MCSGRPERGDWTGRRLPGVRRARRAFGHPRMCNRPLARRPMLDSAAARMTGAVDGHPPRMAGESYTFTTDRTGETVVVTLAGELDMPATFRLEPELERLTRHTDASVLVIDMGGVEFMDSSVLAMLLATQQQLRAAGIRFLLANPSGSVRRMLEFTGAGEELPVTAWPPGA